MNRIEITRAQYDSLTVKNNNTLYIIIDELGTIYKGNLLINKNWNSYIPSIVSIAVTTPPTKISYLAGELLDLTGMLITAYYDNGISEVISSGYTTVPTNGATLTAEDTSILISYRGNTCTQAISVKALSSIAVTAAPTKTTYALNETLDLTGMIITATYSDSSTLIITSSEYTTIPVNGSTLSTAGTTTITITYQNKTATQDVTVLNVAIFTVIDPEWNSHAYYFEPDTDFGTWLSSAYNTDNWAIPSGSSYICHSNYGALCNLDYTAVLDSDAIDANEAYLGTLGSFGVCLTNGTEMEKYPCKPNQTWGQWVNDPLTSWAGYTISDNKVKNANNRTICIDNMVVIPVDPASEIGFVLGENYPQFYSLGQYAFTVTGGGSGTGDFTFEYENESFAQWVTSSFNTAGYSININDEVECAGSKLYDPNTGMTCRSMDPILNNTIYTLI